MIADDIAPAQELPDASGEGLLPPTMYFDPAVLEAERRDVFPYSWNLVGDVSGLTQPGDFLTETLGDQPVAVVRDRDGRLRCFANVCRHRGCTLLEGAGNTGRAIVCPYHHWSYDLEGALRGMPFRDEFDVEVDLAALGLHEIRMDVWARFAFVNVRSDAPPLREYLGGFADELNSHRIGEMRHLNSIDEVRFGNWKVHVDNAFCAYHFAMVHPTTLYPSQSRTGITFELTEHAGCSFIPWKDLRADVANAFGIEGRGSYGSLNISVFPNLFIGALPNGRLTVLEWTPVTIDSTRLRAWSYGFASDDEAAAEPERQRRVLAEDQEVVRRTHDGMRSPLYTSPGPPHRRELRTVNFHRRLIELLRAGAERQRTPGTPLGTTVTVR